MILSCVFSGLNAVLFKLTQDDFTPISFIGVRYIFVGLIFLIIGLRGRDLIIKKRAHKAIIINTAFFVVTVYMWFIALNYTQALDAAIFGLLTPVLVYIGSVVFLKEPRSIKALTGALIAMVGGILLFGFPSELSSNERMIGNGLLLLSSFVSAGWVLSLKTSYKKASRNALYTISYLTSGVIGLVWAFARNDFVKLSDGVHIESVVALVTSILIPGVASMTLYYAALKRMRAEDSASLLYVDTLTGVLASVLVLGDTLSPVAVASSCVIIFGIIIAHPVHINRLLYYQKEHISKFEELVRWMKNEYGSVSHVLKKLF
jgi:drug/metabolite transporter (DMT)-like permease